MLGSSIPDASMAAIWKKQSAPPGVAERHAGKPVLPAREPDQSSEMRFSAIAFTSA